MKLHRLIAFLFLTAIFVCGAFGQDKQKSHPHEERDEPSMVPGSISQARLKAMQEHEAAAKKIIVAREEALYADEKRKDVKTIMDAMTDDFVEIGPNGEVLHKSQIATMLVDVETASANMSEIQFKLLDPRTAFVIYKLDIDSKYKGERSGRHWRATSIWTSSKKGEWLVRFHQSVPLVESQSNTQ